MRKFVLLPTWVMFMILGIIPIAILQIDNLFFSHGALEDSDYRSWLLVLPISLLQVIWFGSLNNEFSKMMEKKTGELRTFRFNLLLFLFITGSLLQRFIPDFATYTVFFIVSVIVTIFSYLGLLVVLTRNLRKLEDRTIKFGKSEFRNDFILFACYPIGIWFLQPRIRRVLTAENSWD